MSSQLLSYAKSSLALKHGDKTEDELLQRIWNLAEDVRNLVEQLEREQKMHDLYRGQVDDFTARILELEEQLGAAQAIIRAARDLPEMFEAGGRTHSFVPLLDVLASNPASEPRQHLGRTEDATNRDAEIAVPHRASGSEGSFQEGKPQ